MPVDKNLEFVGIDEIQMCNEHERGHIFTDRLLNLRGNPIIPESKESIVSIARKVFPVFVGPNTAVILFFSISTFSIKKFLTTICCCALRTKID